MNQINNFITEEKMKEIWKIVFSGRNIENADNFYELGGDSLLIIELQNKIYDSLGINLSIREILENPTITHLVKYILYCKRVKSSDYFIKKIHSQKKFLNLSYSQQRIWIMNQVVDIPYFFNLGYKKSFNFKINKKYLKEAVKKIMQEQEILLSNFVEDSDGNPVSFINKKHLDNFQVFEISKSKNIKAELNSLVKKSFNLEKDILFRIFLLKRKEKAYDIVLVIHHIIADLWSLKIFFKRLTNIYNSLSGIDKLEDKKDNLKYSDFVLWERKQFNNNAFIKQEKYWLKKFRTKPPELNIKTDYPRPAVNDYSGNSEFIFFDYKLSQKLKNFAAQNNVTLFTLFLAIFGVFLNIFSKQKDIVIGTYDSGRSNKNLKDIMGPMLNNLPLRLKILDDEEFVDFLNTVKNNVLEATENADYPFEALIKKMNISRSTNRASIFDIVLQVFHEDIPKSKKNIFTNGSIKKYLKTNSAGQFDLILQVITESNNKIKLIIEYKTSLYKKQSIVHFLSSIKSICSSICKNKNLKVSDLKLVDYEKTKIKSKLIGPVKKFTKYKNIYEIIEERFFNADNNFCVFNDDDKCDSNNFLKLIKQVSLFLLEKNIKPSDRIALVADRSFNTFVAIIGILKIGAVNVMIDPELPPKRIMKIINSSRAKIILFDKKYQKAIEGYKKKYPIDFIFEYNLNCKYLFPTKISSKSPAFIFYTSGSDGSPKGVILSHGAVINHVYTKIYSFKISSDDKICWNLSLGYVASLWQILTPLFVGCSMHIYSRCVSSDSVRLFKSIAKDEISILEISPCVLDDYLSYIKDKKKINNIDSLRLLSLGGEPIYRLTVENFYKFFSTQLINSYGQTEYPGLSMPVIIPRLFKKTIAPVGGPAPNTKIFILNKNLEPVEMGSVGEICVSGKGLFSRYIKNNLANNLLHHSKLKCKILRTGDYGSLREDGNLDYIGRKDEMINIRGNRVELLEIQAIINGHDKVVRSCVFQEKRGKYKNKLLAYYETTENISIADLKNYMRKYLTEYMIPEILIPLKKIPLNVNKKIDKIKLRKIKPNHEKQKIFSAKNSTEKKILKIWQNVLFKKNINIDANFFDLGGDSLKLIKVLRKLNIIFPNKIKIVELFAYPTIRGLSMNIDGKNNSREIKNN